MVRMVRVGRGRDAAATVNNARAKPSRALSTPMRPVRAGDRCLSDAVTQPVLACTDLRIVVLYSGVRPRCTPCGADPSDDLACGSRTAKQDVSPIMVAYADP